MQKLLLIEDDQTFAGILSRFLSKHGYSVSLADSLRTAESVLNSQKLDVVLLDYRLPDGVGTDLIPFIREKQGSIPVIVITGFNDVRTAVKMLKSGVRDYILKPVNPEELLLTLQSLSPTTENPIVQNTSSSTFIKGESKSAKKLYKHVQLVAPTDMSVIIIGESGTGKEHIARAIHAQSERKNQPFEAIDCGTLNNELSSSELFGHVKGAFTGALDDKTGLLERADGGTVFLDEIGNLSYDVQVKLLRTLQERTVQPVGSGKTVKVDIRLICATNEQLQTAVLDGTFREDLYHRINEFKITMPPLRERSEDLPLFIRHFLKEANERLGRHIQYIPDEVMAIFQKYDWPGNLREMKNIVNRMTLLSSGDTLERTNLPEEMLLPPERTTTTSDLKQLQEEREQTLIHQALLKYNNNKSQVARALNIDRKTLYHKLKKYGLD